MDLGLPSTPQKIIVEGCRPSIYYVKEDYKESLEDHLSDVEGLSTHFDVSGIYTHGYGLTEHTRIKLGIPLGTPKSMYERAVKSYEDQARKYYKCFDYLDSKSKIFIMSNIWNTGMVFDSAKSLVESQHHGSSYSEIRNFLSNNRSMNVRYPGLGNRRAKDYNVIAEGKGWPKVVKATYTNVLGRGISYFRLENKQVLPVVSRTELKLDSEVVFRF